MKSKSIEVKHRGLTLKIFVCKAVKNGRTYTSYQVADYGDDRRKLHCYADGKRARAKAQEIAEGTTSGEDLINYAALKRPIQNAMEDAKVVGLRVDEVRRIVFLKTSTARSRGWTG
jgi:nucleoside-triphosphatase THEP1